MDRPLDIAVDIGRMVVEAQAASLALDLADSADDLIARFPQSGLSRGQILEALKEEAAAIGVLLH
jgi:hypothetical protein